MKELARLWLLSRVIGEVVNLAGIMFCAVAAGWLVFHIMPSAIGKVFGW